MTCPSKQQRAQGKPGAQCTRSLACRHSGARASASPESITTKFAWGDLYPVVFKIGNGGYGFRACAKRRIPE